MTSGERQAVLERTFAETAALHQRALPHCAGAVIEAAAAMVRAISSGAKVLACGNGGSAADAQHFAAELVCRFERERQAWPALALTTDTSVLTAVGNDYDFGRVFARQVEAHGRAGDVLLAISTSGGSPSILAAVAAARAQGLTTIGLTGRDGGVLGTAVDIHVNVPSPVTARTQEVHCTILHVLCDLIERELAG
jgi:D-sedoheptulose 7-phosphate isomerase